MNYYYDILLNFQENYYMFYEWDKEDNIEFVKKIPLFHIDSKEIVDIFNNKIMITNEFLKLIENKTKIKQNKFLKYTAIFSDGKNSLAVEFNDEGVLINKSSLILDDELSINEFMYSINKSNLDYQIIGTETRSKETRQELKIKRLLKLEVQSMYEKKEYSKLKYIYLEWFNELKENVDSMYELMLNKINSTLTNKEYEIYELIKLSYNNV